MSKQRKTLKDTIANENKVIGNLTETFAAKDLHHQQRKSFSILEITGNITLAYYRGKHEGLENGMMEMGNFIIKGNPELKEKVNLFISKNKINK